MNESNRKTSAHARKLPTMSLVFQTIQTVAPVDRLTIQKKTGLSWASVSQMASVLLNSGVAKQQYFVTGTAGKNSYLLDLRKDDYLLIGAHMNFDNVLTLVSNMRGEVLSQFKTPVKSSNLLDTVLSSVKKAAGLYTDRRILAAGVSFPGSVDIDNHVMRQSVFFPEVQNVNIHDLCVSELDFPVFAFHDSDCFLIAEKYLGTIAQQGLTNAVVINAAQGVSMSTMINSQILVSPDANQGEIGHICVVENGDTCLCGKKGCLDMYASARGIQRQYAKQNNLTADAMPSFTEIGYAALNGHADCVKLLEEAGRYLGRVIGYVATILEPETIVLCGEHIKYLGIFEHSLKSAYRNTVYFNNTTRLMFSDLGNNAQAVGAALYAFERIRDDFLTELLNEM